MTKKLEARGNKNIWSNYRNYHEKPLTIVIFIIIISNNPPNCSSITLVYANFALIWICMWPSCFTTSLNSQ